MNRSTRTVLVLAALAALGCAAKRLPPGTPPPEYETRELPPWSGDATDAGSSEPATPEAAPPPADTLPPPVTPEPPKTEPVPLDAGPSPSPDAGVR